jgi:predicted HicB family RNase H-like nuclease
VVNKQVKKTKKENADYYTYRVTWSAEDQEYVGLCAEFPSLSWLAGSKEEALYRISNLVKEVLLDMRSNNELIPEPLAMKHFSGKFTARIPPEVHRSLAIEAAEAKISFNRLISSKLSK